ncbi:MAG: T9SS type A sorting domain-containing protein [Bacteroidetes bacterium]|nr:T9SS type A sorting domain-containing protein [Bacteroidota bacterium]MBT3747842.1 T9SS type A sorting domain-containing protein [Bacteroidota bacterium]MBT4398266.1 T9SS type A sorting domain-containing protein [Bacteroidota bacterium]MBT5425534.1 T9SS type A sorting domain-containing protein [Bacteroidota bacterium]
MKRIIISFLSLVFSVAILGQSLPKNLLFDETQHRLKLTGAVNTGFYEQSTVERVYINFYEPDYWEKLKQNYNSQQYVLARLSYNGEVYDSVGVQFKGQTSYRKPRERGLDKFSFDIKLSHIIDGQDIDGYSTLNFNNAWEDASFMKEVVYGSLAKKHIPAAQGNFIRLYLNGAKWGLYPNIQQVNSDFLKEWFMTNDGIRWRADIPLASSLKNTENTGPNWGDGTAALNYLGNNQTEYKKYYTLKSSGLDDPWDYLIKVCDVLNNTPLEFLLDSIKNYLNVDATLWFLATEILFSDDDSYVHKGKMDYSLYLDEETGLMHPLEIDGNSAMKKQLFNWDVFYHDDNVNYPLLNRLLEIPELRQRYIAHVKTILEDSFTEETFDELIDPLSGLIDIEVKTDVKKFQSYGKFLLSVNDLRLFIEKRKDYCTSQAELQRQSPTITYSRYVVNDINWENPDPGDLVQIKTRASHPSGIKEVNMYYSKGFFGNFTMIKMTGNTREYKAVIEGLQAGDFVRFYVEAVASDGYETRAYSPAGAEHDVYYFRVNIAESISSDVVINEIMASNDHVIADQDGEFDDWIELHNNSAIDIQLDGYFLTDNPGKLNKWPFPEGTSIKANDYLFVWADKDEEQDGLHTNFKLSASGEQLYLIDDIGQIADQVYFLSQESNESYGRLPNGLGAFQKLQPSPNNENSIFLSTDNPKEPENKLLVYPNPASQFIYVTQGTNQSQTLVIQNILGEVVHKQSESDESTQQINISNLKPGVYIVRSGANTTIFQKQ